MERKDHLVVKCKIQQPTQYVTDNVLTPNEYIKLLAWRARVLKLGFPPAIEWNEVHDPIKIAKEEIRQRKIPLNVIRQIPDLREPTGYREEVWDISEMHIRDH